MCSWVDGRAVAKELLTNHGELSTVVTTSTTTTVVADAPACQGPCATVQTTTTTLGTTVVATTIVGNTATTTTTVTLASTWLDYLGRVAHILSYNLFCLEIFIAFTAFIVVISILLMWGIEHHKAQ